MYDDNDDEFNGDEYDGDEYVGDEYDDGLVSDDTESDVVACPHCQAEIFEDSVQCPVCGEYVTFVHNVWTGRSFVWVVLGLLGILATIWVLLS